MTFHRAGNRFQLIVYRRILRRFHGPTLIFIFIFIGLWLLDRRGFIVSPISRSDYLIIAGGLSLILYIFTIIAPWLAYVQPRKDHLRVQTPFYRLNIPYHQIRATRPVRISSLFPPHALPPDHQRILAPYFAETALAIDLHDWPISPRILRLFFHRTFFAPDMAGMVFIVRGWLSFSQQMSTMMGAWSAQETYQNRLEDPLRNILWGDQKETRHRR